MGWTPETKPFPVFAIRVREALAAKEMTQEAMARALDVSARTGQKWATGESVPGGRKLVELSVLLEREPAWFFSEPEKGAAA